MKTIVLDGSRMTTIQGAHEELSQLLVGQKLHKISSFFLSKEASFNSKYAVSSNGILAFFVEYLGEINISKKDDRLFGGGDPYPFEWDFICRAVHIFADED